MRGILVRFGVSSLLFALGIACGGSRASSNRYDMVEHFAGATQHFEGAIYPDFVEQPTASGPLDLDGDVRVSLTPPFPSRVTYELDVPESGFLDLSLALVMAQRVRRARVEFVVTVKEGETTTTCTR